MTQEKTREELEAELDEERGRRMEAEWTAKVLLLADSRYAAKLVQVIVYGEVGLILVAVLTAIVALVMTKP